MNYDYDVNESEVFDFVNDEDLFEVFDETYSEPLDEETKKLLAQFQGCPLDHPGPPFECILAK